MLDFNGTLVRDGALIDGVAERMARLAERLSIHVVTGDTFGSAARALTGMPCKVVTLDRARQAEAKLADVQTLGPDHTACIGNGHNDRLILAAAAPGVAVIEGEGTAPAALAAATIVRRAVLDALDLFAHPLRIVATLRSLDGEVSSDGRSVREA